MSCSYCLCSTERVRQAALSAVTKVKWVQTAVKTQQMVCWVSTCACSNTRSTLCILVLHNEAVGIALAEFLFGDSRRQVMTSRVTYKPTQNRTSASWMASDEGRRGTVTPSSQASLSTLTRCFQPTGTWYPLTRRTRWKLSWSWWSVSKTC